MNGVSSGGGALDLEERWDVWLERVLIALLIFLPLAFGGVQAWSELVAFTLAGVLAVALVLRSVVCPGARLSWTPAWIPLGGFVAVLFLQVVPLPVSIVEAISPRAAEHWRAALPDGDLPGRVTLSMYPDGTWHDLRIAFLVLTVFAVVHNVFRDPARMARLSAWIGGAGVAVALLFFGQRLLGTNRTIYGLVPSPGRPFGPFVNGNHFAQFLCLSIGASICVALHRWVIARPPGDSHGTTGHGRSWASGSRLGLGDRWGGVLPFAIAAIVCASAVVLSLSRAGTAALGLSGIGFFIVLSLRERGRLGRSATWLLASSLLGMIVIAGFGVAFDELRTLADRSSYEGRWVIARGLFRAFLDFPLVGYGQGAHEFAFLGYDERLSGSALVHADTDYPQLLAETGVIGTGCFLAFLGIAAGAWWRASRARADAGHVIAIGWQLGLGAILIHSVSDFGQRVPANACLSAVGFAILLRLGARQRTAVTLEGGREPPSRLRFAWAVPVLAIVLAVWRGGVLAAAAEEHGRRAAVVDARVSAEPPGRPDDHGAILRELTAARNRAPRDVHWVERWGRSGVRALRWTTVGLRLEGRELDGLAPGARVIADDLRRARLLAPTYGILWTLEGRARAFLGEADEARELFLAGHARAPNHPVAMFFAGLVAFDDGDDERGLGLLRGAVDRRPHLFDDALGIFLGPGRRQDVALALAGDDDARLLRVTNALSSSGGPAEILRESRRREATVLEEHAGAERLDGPGFARLARLKAAEGERESAVGYFQRALQVAYDEIGWRLERATLLFELDRLPEATRELRICLRLRPGFRPAHDLLAKVSARTR